MKELIKLAEKIEDKDLRDKTIELLKELRLSNKEMKYKPLKLEESPAGYPGFEHHMEKGGLVKHTKNVTELAIKIADFIEDQYCKVNKDYVIAGALLHDLMRAFDFKKSGNEYGLVGKLLSHEELIGCELYARSFPEEVVYIVLSHLKSEGLILEANIVHFADSIDAYTDAYVKELLKETVKKLIS